MSTHMQIPAPVIVPSTMVGGRGSVDNVGRYIPPVDYTVLEENRAIRIDPSTQRPLGMQRVPIAVPNAPLDANLRVPMALRLALHSDLSLATGRQRESWVLSMFELCIPGWCAAYMGTWVSVERFDITEAQLRFWSRGEVAGDVAGTWIPGPADLTTVQDQFQIPQWPRMVRQRLDRCTDLMLPAVIGMLLYAITKTPTDNNGEAFTTRRPLAAARSLAMTALADMYKPALHLYSYFSSIMVSSTGLRIGICRTLAAYCQLNSLGAQEGALIAQVRIWRRHQLTSFFDVRELMIRAGAALRQVRALAAACEAFDAHARRYNEVARSDPLVEYRNAIYGALSDIKPINAYQPLVLLMRDYKRLEAANEEERQRWTNFASQTPSDVTYEAELQRVARGMDIHLPSRVANA